MTANTVEFWFDFASPYSYLAAMRIEAIARESGRALRWRPFLLGPIFEAQGWNNSPFVIYPAKGRYMWRDLERSCAELAIPFAKPSQYPRNGVLASRVACLGEDAPWLPAFVRNVFSANFARDLDISQAEVIADCLGSLVPDPDAFMAKAGDDDNKGRLRLNTERAVALGIFGAPTFMVGEELFWGNDRLAQAIAWPLDNSPKLV